MRRCRCDLIRKNKEAKNNKQKKIQNGWIFSYKYGYFVTHMWAVRLDLTGWAYFVLEMWIWLFVFSAHERFSMHANMEHLNDKNEVNWNWLGEWDLLWVACALLCMKKRRQQKIDSKMRPLTSFNGVCWPSNDVSGTKLQLSPIICKSLSLTTQ